MSRTLSGEKFNEMYNGRRFYKFLNNNLDHNGYIYRLGLNVDVNEFSNEECCEGGLCFCSDQQYHLHWNSYGDKIGFVEVPRDSVVSVGENGFKADQLFVTKIVAFDEMDNEFWLNILDRYEDLVRYVKQQMNRVYGLVVADERKRLKSDEDTPTLKYFRKRINETCLCILRQNGLVLRYIKNTDDDTVFMAIEQNGMSLAYVDAVKRTFELCLAAVEENGIALQYVPSVLLTGKKALILAALKQDGLALQFVTDQTDEMCRVAVSQNFLASQYVNTPHSRIKNGGSIRKLYRSLSVRQSIALK